QRRGDLLRDVYTGARIERPGATNAFIKGFPLDQFHRVKILACLKTHSELVDDSDVFMSQRCSCARFANKAFAGVGTSRSDVDFNDLKGNLALERRVGGAISYTHRPAPKLVKTSVLAPINLIDSEAR